MVARIATGSFAIPAPTIYALLGTLVLAFLPHLAHLPPTIILFCLAFAGWRLMAELRGWPLPGRLIRFILTVMALAGVLISFGTLAGREPGTALLAVMLGLKLLEMQGRRDTLVVLMLAYFFIVILVLYSQSLWLMAYIVMILLLLTSVLIQINHYPAREGLGTSLRRAGALLLQAVPLMLILFILFPRIHGPLWGSASSGGGSGLNDTMSPGSISKLGQSNAIAFRVRFDGPIPASRLLYWRGPVLWQTDGQSWRSGVPKTAPAATRAALVSRGETVSYQVTLEPHHQRWLYALDIPVSIPPGSHRGHAFQLLADQPVDEITRYRVRSVSQYRLGLLSSADRRRALQLPAGGNPRTVALARQWRARYPDDGQLVQHALEYFRQQPFYYTLQPPLLGGDIVDEFLFQTRRGFCEHYAASFTVLMRAAGIPTRVVTGYQGGELNPVGHYLVVRQRDAHAWAEVWLADQGWQRIDPTAAVSPARIEKGIDSALESERQGLLQRGLLADVWRQFRYGADALSSSWTQWVLGYGPKLQNRLLSSLGMAGTAGKVLGMILGGGLMLFIMTWCMLQRHRGNRDPVAQAYQRFCHKLSRRGLKRAPAEGPQDFADRVITRRPDLAAEVTLINRLYTALRYGAAPPALAISQLRKRIRTFRP